MWRKLKGIIKKILKRIKSKINKIKKKLKRKIKNMIPILLKWAILILGMFPANKKLIIFESFHGKQYSDNPRAIYEYMKKHHPDYVLYWSVDRRYVNIFKDRDIKYAKRFSLKWVYIMARAKYWVINTRLPLWIPKPKRTIYLQTWHGTPLKRLGVDIEEVHMPGTNTEIYKRNFLFEASKWDYLISPNEYSSKIFRRAFGFNKTMIESGYPRNDFLVQNKNDQETIQAIKKKCGIPNDKKVILYAPTWRDNQYYAKGKYKFKLEFDLELMKEELSDEYVILLRLHYLVAENLDLSGYDDFIFDLSRHEDIRDLYLISDILITDYSSVFFDYANLKRPMLFFVYDIEDYRDYLRGFYVDFEKVAPGPLVKTTEELIEEIRNIEENATVYADVIELFYNKFCYLEDGRATERVVKEVFNRE